MPLKHENTTRVSNHPSIVPSLIPTIFSILLLVSTYSDVTDAAAASMALRHTNNKRQRQRHRKQEQHNDPLSNLQTERDILDRGYNYIIGTDESGRGCIAGPVTAASVCILPLATTLLNRNSDSDDTPTPPPYVPIEGVKDSKLLTPAERLAIYNKVISQPDIYAYAISHRSPTIIDNTNIHRATMDAMRESIETILHSASLPSSYAIVDGKKSPKLHPPHHGTTPCRPYVNADDEVYTVSLASIVAKVTRDEYMTSVVDVEFPMYGFGVHMGYPRSEHVEAIHRYGTCVYHRQSTRPVKGR